MSSNGIRKLLDADAGYDLIVTSDFQKFLVEDVILVVVDEVGNIADYGQDIELITLDGVVGEEDVMQFEIEEVVAHGAHHFVGLHVVHVEDVEVVEAAVE